MFRCGYSSLVVEYFWYLQLESGTLNFFYRLVKCTCHFVSITLHCYAKVLLFFRAIRRTEQYIIRGRQCNQHFVMYSEGKINAAS